MKKDQPLLSIIIVTYQAEKHLEACFKNIKKYFNADIQLIVIDGGSKDNTLSIIKTYEYMIDFWQSEPDKGIYDAMNKAMKFVKGQWVLFLGADDLLEDGFTPMLSELKEPDTIYYGMVDVNQLIYKGPYSGYRLSKLNICHQTIFYPASVFMKYSYSLKYPICADWFLNIQCWKDKDFKFAYKSHLISKFGIEGISSTAVDKTFKNQQSSIILKYLGIKVWLRFMLRELKRKLLLKE